MVEIDFWDGALEIGKIGRYFTIDRKPKHKLGKQRFRMNGAIWNGEIYKLTKNRTWIYLY